ncbi:DNA primase [Chitinispirillales bacterium ANBcel5]|uniref:DNA primase n=1 Tax=Cellulosispirillum alkaliphilum TaxID=3039283 RepID=UPI002A55F265|nr:DNA primase [Chitinispirillales bacterium ANBcel5]
MVQRFDSTVKEDIRSRADIASIVGRYVTLKQSGQTLKGLCPFHKEKTPSFHVNPVQGFFHCFGCGKGGDVFTFVQEMEGIGFVEALKMLAEETGVILETTSKEQFTPESQSVSAVSKTELLDMHALAGTFFYTQIRSNPKAIEYFKSRGLKAETVKEFGLGYAPPGWSALSDYLKSKGFSETAIVQSGLALQKEEGRIYDRFRDRIIFPLYDLSGRVIAFAGRGMEKDAQPKYLNSPETLLYKKNRLLYGLFKARQSIREQGYVLIVEGYMDYLSLYQAGVKNVAATSGTAFTAEHAHLIRRFSRRVILVFDGDDAGLNAAQKAITVLAPASLDVSILTLPKDHDPDSYVGEFGVEGFNALIKSATRGSLFLIKRAMEGQDHTSAHGKRQIIETLTPYMNAITDALVREEFQKELSEMLRVDIRHIKAAGTTNEPQSQQFGNSLTSRVDERYFHTLEGSFLRILLTSPKLIEQARMYVSPETLTDEVSGNIYSVILDTYTQTGGVDSLSNRIDSNSSLKGLISMMMVKPALLDHIQDDLVQKIIHLRAKFLRHKIRDIRRLLKTDPENRAHYLEQLKDFSIQLKELDEE